MNVSTRPHPTFTENLYWKVLSRVPSGLSVDRKWESDVLLILSQPNSASSMNSMQ
jgi:hypothetical protein